jgi:hypothetical protein
LAVFLHVKSKSNAVEKTFFMQLSDVVIRHIQSAGISVTLMAVAVWWLNGQLVEVKAETKQQHGQLTAALEECNRAREAAVVQVERLMYRVEYMERQLDYSSQVKKKR